MQISQIYKGSIRQKRTNRVLNSCELLGLNRAIRFLELAKDVWVKPLWHSIDVDCNDPGIRLRENDILARDKNVDGFHLFHCAAQNCR